MWPLSSGTRPLAETAFISLVLSFGSLANTPTFFTATEGGMSTLNRAYAFIVVLSSPEAELLLPREYEGQASFKHYPTT